MSRIVVFLSLFFSIWTGTATVLVDSAATKPDTLVTSVAQRVIETIKQDRSVHRTSQQTGARVTAAVMPCFDFLRMTSLALGIPWRQATPSQKERLSYEFQTLLIRTYMAALSQYTDQQVKVLYTHQVDQEAQVKTLIVGSTMKDLNVDYRLHQQAGVWKIYDISVTGVSLVLNYRQQFQTQVRQRGLDGLIATLADKNRVQHGQSQ